MTDSGEDRTFRQGILTNRKVIPDHQLDDFHQLADDALRLFRITLVVIGIYASLFAVLLQIGSDAIIATVRNPIIALGSLCLLLAIGGSFASYQWARIYTTNAIKSREYIGLSEQYKPTDDSELGEDGMVYKYYWKRAAELGSRLRIAHYMIAFSTFSVYVGVIYTPMGLLSFYVSFPDWTTTVALYGPLMVVGFIALLKEFTNSYEGIVYKEVDEDD